MFCNNKIVFYNQNIHFENKSNTQVG
jgi:hypothetical protein